MAMLAQQWLHPSERALEEASGALVGHHRSHLTRELAEVAGKEALMLPIQAGRQQEFVAVEIRAHPHLDAFDKLHQYEARLQRFRASELAEHRAHIPAVGQPPDIVVDGSVGPVELQNVTSRIFLQKVERRSSIGKFPVTSDRQPGSGKNPLGIGAVILQAIAIGAAADDVEATTAKLVLQRPAVHGDIFEQNDPVSTSGADPIQFAAPVRRSLD
jgi:hypothetical protein